ncbi:NAD(P)-dependent oxidoreductase [Effusibacillus dendaii]|uniref:D-glycerate dehydrogenase n=1 Tax=Effusibacillus dendaii TaxID=2743772 RepID=A0A7I8DCT2_9BACL|nr:NAD(P)-dependent oxidoreductase [Effusibacillus dendaii]BCJ87988.1 D-glycerate dehydrogenase [Effusibacillus dendaii]
MYRPKVFISQWMPPIGVDMIRQYCDVDYYNGTTPLSKQDFISRAKEADALLIFMCDTIDGQIVQSIPNVRVISSFGKGYDNIDVTACTAQNILVTINPDALTDSTADIAIGLILSLARNILPSDSSIRSGKFNGWHATNFLGRDFHHSRLGIIGFGAIGQAIARRAKGFDTEICYYDVVRQTAAEQELGAVYKPLEELLNQSDFLVVAVNLQPDTIHLLSRNELQQVKPGSFLINISRGSIVDEQAVAEALDDGRLQGYAADVFEFEDRMVPQRPSYIPSSLLEMREKTVFTPHIGTGTIEARERLAVSSANQLLAALHGQIPSGAVNRVNPPKLLP